jgi:protein-S-isoprenylcysteine O-methyltransferase Ste14
MVDGRMREARHRQGHLSDPTDIRAMTSNVWLAIGTKALLLGAVLFGAAGSLSWPAAWAFLIALFATTLLVTRWLARHDPALLIERMKPLFQTGQPAWDRILMSVMSLQFMGWLVLMGLDVIRFRWSHTPVWLQVIGGAGVALGLWVCSRAFTENTFLASVVRIQSERGQRVVSTGPYAVVRHPLYTGMLILFPSTAVMLGSLWGLAASGLLAGGIVLRTVKEERELRRGLDGYAEYIQRVRYRLLPLVW